MIRLRYGKWRARGSVPGGISATSRPRSAIALPRRVLGRVENVDAAGDHGDRAGLERAVVRGGSMPRARPETTTDARRPRSCASCRAKRQAAAEALRAPTSATAGRVEQA